MELDNQKDLDLIRENAAFFNHLLVHIVLYFLYYLSLLAGLIQMLFVSFHYQYKYRLFYIDYCFRLKLVC